MRQNVIAEKKKIRQEKRSRRDAMTEAERAAADGGILEKLLLLPEYQSAAAVLTYVSARGETDTKELIRKALRAGRIVAAPKVLGMEMQFRVISSFADLEEGYFGIWEPKEECPPFSFAEVLPEDILLLVPGTAFDRAGGRIGYGKGFYDRFFAKHPEIRRIGLAYEVQLTEDVPREEHDFCMDKIVTEREIYDVRNESKKNNFGSITNSV